MSREYFTIYPKKFYEKIDNTHIWILGIFFFSPNKTNFKIILLINIVSKLFRKLYFNKNSPRSWVLGAFGKVF